MSQQGYSKDEIRRAVREALLEALPAEAGTKNEPGGPKSELMNEILKAAQSNCKTPVAVDLDTDRKVNKFVTELAKCLQDRNVAGLIRSGRLKFKSAARSGSPRSTTPAAGHNSGRQTQEKGQYATNGRIESGVLTEARIMGLAKTHQRIEVGKSVVLTPLAKDRARRLKVEIVRQ